MISSARIYGENAPAYVAAGLPVFPVNTRHKRPAVKGWQKSDPRRSRAWAASETLGAADGLGIVMGKACGITEVDVDGVGEAWLAAAVERFGETPITIRTAAGKGKLWFRHDGEGRRIRPIKGLPIDVLGAGFTIAPPSWREDLAAEYSFRKGGLADLAGLPRIKPGAFDSGFERTPEAVREGQRNASLWRYCMAQARYCDDVDSLLDVAETWANCFPNPLPLSEVKRCAQSAWGYETTGRNYLGLRKPQLTDGDRIMDALLDQPDAFTLYQYLTRWHSNRAAFAIAPRAMSEAGSPPWSRQRIGNARDILVERGFLEELVAPDALKRRTGRYRLAGHYPRSGHNHNTPSPPFPTLIAGGATGWGRA